MFQIILATAFSIIRPLILDGIRHYHVSPTSMTYFPLGYNLESEKKDGITAGLSITLTNGRDNCFQVSVIRLRDVVKSNRIKGLQAWILEILLEMCLHLITFNKSGFML